MENPTIQGRYKILRQIGGGGFGLTFLAEDLHLPNRPYCVVKKLHTQFPDENSRQIARRLFQQEAETLYHLGSHPKIPTLIAHFEENGEFFLVQQLIEGWTLGQEFSQKRNCGEKEAAELVWQILDVLSFVHSRNVIHRDIKPTNLIRRQADGRIFLIDFGAVKQVAINPNNQNQTFKSTIAIGSSGYMPPEQTAGKPRFSSDLYAAGLVTIEALTGLNPIKLGQNPTTGEFVWQHKVQIKPEFADFLSKLVRYDFRQRYNSATEAFAALRMIVSASGYSRKVVTPQVVIQQPVQPMIYKPELLPKPLDGKIPQPNIDSTVAAIPQQQRTLAQPAPRNFPPPLISDNNAYKPASKNDFKLAAGIVGAVLCLFLVAGFMLYAAANYKTTKEIPSAFSNKTEDSKPGPILQEAINQANEAEKKEEKATQKSDWEEIGNQYKRAASLSESVAATSPDYDEAQLKAKTYREKSDTAFQKSQSAAAESTNYTQNSGNTNYPTTVSTTTYPKPTPYPTSTQAKPVVTMPAKQSYSTYLAYNIVNYDRLEKKVITTNDALFTSSVEKQTNNMRDSGVVRINLQGGSYSSANLAFKAPHGQRLSSGNYPNAQEYLWQSPTMYAVSFDKLSCFERGNHSFTINGIIYDELYANISYLDASFTITCDTRKVMGRIRYDAR